MSDGSLDNSSVIMEIRAASPGDEGARAAGSLFRIYQEFALERGWRVEVLGSRSHPDGGYREVIATIEGQGVYGKLRFERGLHCIQRMIRQEGRDRVRTLPVHIDTLPLPAATELEFEDIDLWNFDEVVSCGALATVIEALIAARPETDRENRR